MRGAVSVALVYHFFDFSDESEHVASIIGMTIIVVIFATMVFGAFTKLLLDIMLGKGERTSLPKVFALSALRSCTYGFFWLTCVQAQMTVLNWCCIMATYVLITSSSHECKPGQGDTQFAVSSNSHCKQAP
jgi:hypothetical protein